MSLSMLMRVVIVNASCPDFFRLRVRGHHEAATAIYQKGNVMLTLALTGGIGSGKSTLSRAFSRCGAHICDLDLVVRRLMEPGTPLFGRIASQWPGTIREGRIDRAGLASIVFADSRERERLNFLTHTAVWEEVDRELAELSSRGEIEVAIVDFALLPRSSREFYYHANIVVSAEVDIRRMRLRGRGMESADIERRLASQVNAEEMLCFADIQVDNSGSIEDLQKCAVTLWHEWVLPFAHNLGGGSRIGVCSPPGVEACKRIVRRLEAHGCEGVFDDDGRLRVFLAEGSESGGVTVNPDVRLAEALTRAGYVYARGAWRSARPDYFLEVLPVER